MSETFNTATIDALAKRFKEPAWLTELRRAALAKHTELPWPHASDDIWRRTDVSLLDPSKGFVPTEPTLQPSVLLTDARLAELTKPLGGEALAVRVNGSWLHEPRVPGLTIEDFSQALKRQADPLRQVLEADGMTPAEQKLSTLNGAFHHDDVLIQVPKEISIAQPVRLVHLISASAQQAVFPLTVITVGSGSSITLIDEYVSIEPAAAAASHLIHGPIQHL